MIQLEPAFQWKCQRCGITNYHPGEEVSETEIEPPRIVHCRECGCIDDAVYEEE